MSVHPRGSLGACRPIDDRRVDGRRRRRAADVSQPIRHAGHSESHMNVMPVEDATAAMAAERGARGPAAGRGPTRTTWCITYAPGPGDDGTDLAGRAAPPAFDPAQIARTCARIREPLHIVAGRRRRGPRRRASAARSPRRPATGGWSARCRRCTRSGWATGPSARPTASAFPYVAGEMANGIATTAHGDRAWPAPGMLGFFGAAGLGARPGRDARSTSSTRALGDAGRSWGVNLIHSPNEPALEERVADLLLRRGVPAHLARRPSWR